MMEVGGLALISISLVALLFQHRSLFSERIATPLKLQKRFGYRFLEDHGRKLEWAGFPSTDAPRFFARSLYALLCGIALGLILIVVGLPFYIPLVTGTILYMWPTMTLNARIRSRQKEIRLTLPYYLDLLTLALEAGLDLIAAVEEVVGKDSPNALREELLVTLKSIRVGTPRSIAFVDLGRRTGVEALTLWASSISQAEELGSSLGNLLRLQAESLRQQLFREAEEKAQKAPMKMLIPLVAFIFPVVFLLLFTPLLMRLFEMF